MKETELYLRSVNRELKHLKCLFYDIVKLGPRAFATSGTSDRTKDGRGTGEIRREISAGRSDACRTREKTDGIVEKIC